MKRLRLIPTLLAMLLIAFILNLLGLVLLAEIPVFLIFGWTWFLVQTLPVVQPDWSALGLAIVALGLLIGGIHCAGCRWANRRSSFADGVGPSEPPLIGATPVVWKARWTACLVAALLLTFTAGISVVGVVHQAVWMATGKERMIFSNRYEFFGRSQSKNNLKQIGLGLHNYHDLSETFPAGGTFDSDGRPLHSAMTMILPFIEQQALFERISLQEPWSAPANRNAFESVVVEYQFPGGVPNPELSEHPVGFALTNYAGNVRVLRLGQAMPLSAITDGTSNTILFGEANEGLRPWGDPLNVRDPAIGINQGPKGFGSPFHGGVQMLLADGSVRFISESVLPAVLRSIATPDSGDVIGEF